jgi:hypothetical protein
MAFGPDGYLYIGVGDHGTAANGQNFSVLMGKLLRIDIRSDDFPADANRNYAVPPTNPFISTGTPPEAICRGLRNPFRCFFDVPSNSLYIADVGELQREEVDRVFLADGFGQNFGWPCREGLATGFNFAPNCSNPPSFTDPLIDFTHAQLPCITGGVVYRGSAIPGLAGRYLFGGCANNSLYSFLPSNPVATLRSHNPAPFSPYCFATTAAGEVYIGGSSGIVRLLPGLPPNPDCNHNAIRDACEISGGLETDFNSNGVPDSCERTCPADFNASGSIDTQDILDFISRWFTGQLATDFNSSSGLDIQDIFDYLNAWFTGCH